MEKNLIYRAASMTKPVTAVAVMQMVEQGKLDLFEPVSKYFPALKNTVVGSVEGNEIVSVRPAEGCVRVYQLLSHCSGIATPPVENVPSQQFTEGTLAEGAEFYCNQPLAFEPATAQMYSTGAFDVAAHIVEMLTDMPYDVYLKKYIFGPLEMLDTTFTPSKAQWDRMIAMHGRDGEGKSVDVAMPEGCVFGNYEPCRFLAGAGLATTAEDYSHFAQMLLNGGLSHTGARVLKEESVNTLKTPFVSVALMPGDTQWGLGVRVLTHPSYPYGLKPGVFGWSGAYGTHFWVDPENRLTAVYMKNCTYDGGAGCQTGNEFEADVTAALE